MGIYYLSYCHLLLRDEFSCFFHSTKKPSRLLWFLFYNRTAQAAILECLTLLDNFYLQEDFGCNRPRAVIFHPIFYWVVNVYVEAIDLSGINNPPRKGDFTICVKWWLTTTCNWAQNQKVAVTGIPLCEWGNKNARSQMFIFYQILSSAS